jgi:Putative transposase DNA-binding domain
MYNVDSAQHRIRLQFACILLLHFSRFVSSLYCEYIIPPVHTIYSLLMLQQLQLVKKRSYTVYCVLCTDQRLLTSQRHSKFNQRLMFKAGCRQKALRDLEEHGTSMTCSNCGNIKRDLGRSETYKCERCKMKAGRDSNSARNHLIKAAFGKENY